MGSLRSAILGSLFVAAASAAAQNVPVERYTLPNGMIVILHQDHSLPVVSVNLWYRVGSKDEPPHRSGFAHLFEHLMFMGTHRVPQGQFDQIMEAGGGDNNANTEEDRTDFYDTGPSNLLPTLLWLEADRLETLGRDITQAKLNLQRDVVKNERRERTENTPYGTADEAINGLMYPAGHPYHTSVIGSMADLSAATVQDVKNFFATYYVPNNVALAIAGDFQPARIKPLIAHYFGTLPRRKAVPRKPVPALKPLGLKRVTMRDRVEAIRTSMIWRSPAYFKPGDPEMDLTASILADGVNSRLYRRLVVRDKLATDVSAYQESHYLSSLFHIDVTLATGATPTAVERAVDQELARLKAEGPSDAELKRQAAKLEVNTLSNLQSVENVAATLNEYQFYFGRPNAFRQVLEDYRRATPASVRAVERRVLDFKNRLILNVLPLAKAPAPPSPGALASDSGGRAQALTRKRGSDPRDVRPHVAPPKPFAPPSPVRFTLSNGIVVQFWRRPELPLMDVVAHFRGGADLDPADKAGRAHLAAEMLGEGAGPRDEQAFQNALDLLGASFTATAGHVATDAQLSVLSRNFGPAMALYADALRRPRFDPAVWQRIRRVEISDLIQERADPDEVAANVGLREFFGAAHPYGRPLTGTPESVGRLSLADAKAAYARIFRPQNATLFVAGSLDEATLKGALEKALGGWHAPGARNEAPTYAAPANTRLRVVLVDKPGAVQTAIRFYLPAPPYQSPNRLPLQTLGTVLGGTFTSRLNQDLRESKGYTYGAFSRYSFAPGVGYFMAQSDVRTDVTGASLKEFLNIFRETATGDVTGAEVHKAVESERTSTVNAMASLGGLLGAAANLETNGRPFGALAQDLSRLSRLTPAQVNAVAKSGLPLEEGLIVLVGDKTAILPQLTALGLPTPEEVTNGG